MSAYNLRDIDTTLWNRAKVRAKADGVTLKDAIFALMDLYAKGDITIAPPQSTAAVASIAPMKRAAGGRR